MFITNYSNNMCGGRCDTWQENTGYINTVHTIQGVAMKFPELLY